MSWWGTEGVGSWLPFSAGIFWAIFFTEVRLGSFCHRRSIFQNSSSYLCPARCSVVIIIHNLGLPALFAMSLCHCITSTETWHVSQYCTDKFVWISAFSSEQSTVDSFPCSWASWESSQGTQLLSGWPKPNCCDLKLFRRHSAPVCDPCFSDW